MHNEIRNIRKNIIDKIIVISFIFFTPAYIAAISRWGQIGWQPINIIHTCFFIFLLFLLIFRKRLSTESKVYSIVFMYSAMGIAALWFMGFTSIHYFVIIAIATGSILAERKTAFIFISTITLLYLIVGILYVLHLHEASVELNSFSHSILQWTTIILSLIAFSAIFLEGFGELYHRLVNKIEEKLKDSEMRWHFSVDGSNLGLWDWNIVTNKVFFSKQWKKMLGFQDDEVADDINEWKNRVHPDDLESVMDILHAYLGGKNEIYSSEHRMLCKNGSYKWILDRGKIVSYTKDGKPKRMIGTHADITEQKLAELELKKSNATKDRFFSIIAHDLKNPFNSMIGLSEALNENFEEIDKKTQRKFITAIHEGILKTYDLLEELLLWSRTQRNTIDFFPKPVDLLMVLTEVLEPLQMAVENKSIEIILKIPSGMIVFADRFMLSFVLRNIISNALKFTPRNGKITIESSTLDRNGKRSIQIVIHDTGIGIDKSYLERIFDIGQNVSRPGTENEKGTGMGLPICYEFVKKHGGDIWVDSKPNKGSHFFVAWPVQEN